MNRSLRVERIYSLGDYKNIKISDDVVDLPEEFVLNDKLVGLIRMMQLCQIEKTFQSYLAMNKNFLNRGQEEILILLEELESDTMSKLKELFANGKTEN